jgi:hypothetical protein
MHIKYYLKNLKQERVWGTVSYSELGESVDTLSPYFLRFILILSSRLHLGIQSLLFLSGFSTKICMQSSSVNLKMRSHEFNK